MLPAQFFKPAFNFVSPSTCPFLHLIQPTLQRSDFGPIASIIARWRYIAARTRGLPTRRLEQLLGSCQIENGSSAKALEADLPAEGLVAVAASGAAGGVGAGYDGKASWGKVAGVAGAWQAWQGCRQGWLQGRSHYPGIIF